MAFVIRNYIANGTKITPAELVLCVKLQQPVDKFISTPAKVTDLPFAFGQDPGQYTISQNVKPLSLLNL